eukprot:4142191-Pyramimonas_sp.AAC.1
MPPHQGLASAACAHPTPECPGVSVATLARAVGTARWNQCAAGAQTPALQRPTTRIEPIKHFGPHPTYSRPCGY